MFSGEVSWSQSLGENRSWRCQRGTQDSVVLHRVPGTPMFYSQEKTESLLTLPPS